MIEEEITGPGRAGVHSDDGGRSAVPGEDTALASTGHFVAAFLNRKGGVGKSSCCHHLAGSFAASGRRVLLVDVDPQASLTQGLLGPEQTEHLAREETLACLYDDAYDPDPTRLIRRTPIDGVSLLPSSAYLDPYNRPEPERAGLLQSALRTFIDEVRSRFDIVLINCPPNLYLCSWGALIAADFVIVPFQPEDYGSQGITAIQRAIARVRSLPNPGLRLLGYLLMMVQRRLGVHVAYERKLRELYGSQVFETTIPRAGAYAEAVSARLPINHWKPRSAGAKAIAELAAEIEGRVFASAHRPIALTDTRDDGRIAGGVR